jgi:hypothetical protein
MIRATLVFGLVAFASATCDNGCSGHGSCSCDNQCACQCYDNWGMGLSHDSGDCSDRICPFELAWVDAPDLKGQRHRYAECAGKGLCNRNTGECECFVGYEGKGCQRTSCPNDCSGHGTCEYIEELNFGSVESDWRHREFTQSLKNFPVYTWDARKTRGCVCDPEYGDVDCSKRMCPYGSDMMDNRDNLRRDTLYQTQKLTFTSSASHLDATYAGLNGRTFALTFKSKLNETFTTWPIVFDSTDPLAMSNAVKAALQGLPNGVVDDLRVHSGSTGRHNSPFAQDGLHERFQINVTFTGESVQGDQNLLTVEDFYCGDGCYPKVEGLDLQYPTDNLGYYNNATEFISADYNSYECGRRGKCDYDSGLCQCFEGFTGPSCGTCTSLI